MTTTTVQHKKGMLAALAFGALSLAGAASAQHISTRVDNVLVNFPDMQPKMVQGRVMVPVRGVFEHMNAHVLWDRDKQTVTAHRGSDTIILPLNSSYATVNGRQVSLDSPAILSGGRTLVPLRFLSETLGASVEWVEATHTVQIDTTGVNAYRNDPPGSGTARLDSGTVIPFRLNQRLSSNNSQPGDRFTANLDTKDAMNYQGLATGAILEGHVDFARAKTGDTPGVLGLAFDRVRMPDGRSYNIYGSLIGLDANSVTNDNGRLVAKAGAKKDDLKYVGYGAGAGALVAIVTKGNVISNALIGGALGFLFGEIQKDPAKARDVTLDAGTAFGARLSRDLTVRVPSQVRP